MARPRNLAAQKQPVRPRTDESLSLRSADTLGRMIGTLQRQLDRVMRRVRDHGVDVDGAGAPPQDSTEDAPRKTAAPPSTITPPKTATRRQTAAPGETATRRKTASRRRTPAAEPPLPSGRAAAGRSPRAARAARGGAAKAAKRVSRPK